ncbi:hypothetical protein ABIC71_000450 [Herbaspirillum seropedicae]|uniref:hypothetical protein n=1 Tax=Herbaspirillum seropedicae TaxID=964 RepID=UPI0033937411
MTTPSLMIRNLRGRGMGRLIFVILRRVRRQVRLRGNAQRHQQTRAGADDVCQGKHHQELGQIAQANDGHQDGLLEKLLGIVPREIIFVRCTKLFFNFSKRQ